MNDYDKMWQEMGLDVPLHNEVLRSIDQTFKRTVGSQENRPTGIAYFDNVLHESHGGRVKELLELKSKGNKTVGTFCIYVPEESVMAAGLVPIALCGGTQFSVPYAEKTFPRDICPLIKSTLGLAFSKTCPYAPIKSMAVGETPWEAKKKINNKRGGLRRLSRLRSQNPPPISGLDALVVMQAALNDEPVRFTQRLEELNREL